MKHESLREVSISDASSITFDQFFEIYVEALPKGERKPRDAIAALAQREDYSILGLTRSEQVVAFAIVFTSNTAPVGLLEYMATTKTMRNMGLGAQLFRMALERMEARTMIVEVDSEREQANDIDIRIRRKNFYLRQGCVQVEGLDYMMPAVSEEQPPVMDLLYHPGRNDFAVTEASLRTWLQTIYVEVYGRGSDDPAIESMLMRRNAVLSGVRENDKSDRND